VIASRAIGEHRALTYPRRGNILIVITPEAPCTELLAAGTELARQENRSLVLLGLCGPTGLLAIGSSAPLVVPNTSELVRAATADSMRRLGGTVAPDIAVSWTCREGWIAGAILSELKTAQHEIVVVSRGVAARLNRRRAMARLHARGLRVVQID
jgi:hypothetical protein